MKCSVKLRKQMLFFRKTKSILESVMIVLQRACWKMSLFDYLGNEVSEQGILTYHINNSGFKFFLTEKFTGVHILKNSWNIPHLFIFPHLS